MFTLDDDDKVIVDAARDFSDKRVGPMAQEWDETHHFPKDVLRDAAGMGMGAIYVSEDVGGSGMRRLDGVRIFEQLARGCPSVAAYLSIHNMCGGMIDKFGSDQARDRWLPDLCAMTRIFSYCLTEPSSGSDAAALKTKAVLDGDLDDYGEPLHPARCHGPRCDGHGWIIEDLLQPGEDRRCPHCPPQIRGWQPHSPRATEEPAF